MCKFEVGDRVRRINNPFVTSLGHQIEVGGEAIISAIKDSGKGWLEFEGIKTPLPFEASASFFELVPEPLGREIADYTTFSQMFDKMQYNILQSAFKPMYFSDEYRSDNIITPGAKKQSTMTKITNMFKTLLDSDTQTLVKAGYLDSELNLTSCGEDVLQNVLFVANKAALVAAATEEIAENAKK